jgi:hypothetical protein
MSYGLWVMGWGEGLGVGVGVGVGVGAGDEVYPTLNRLLD